jgi:hypothetical protein
MRKTNSKDVLAGLMFLAFGVLFWLLAQGYPMGSARRMGPAYFPNLLALVLILIGGVTTVRGLLSRSTPLGPFAGKALLLVTVAVALFGFAVEGAGLAVATILLVVVSSAAGSSLKLPAAMALALALAAFCVVVFRLALGLPFPIVGPWLGG